MIDQLSGKVVAVKEKGITLQVGDIGFALFVPQARNLTPNAHLLLFTYLHWNAENGPSLFGFVTELERKLFLLIIECPKVGPSLALSILSQLTASQFVQIVLAGDQHALSKLNGIGSKKAEQIIVELKDKIGKMTTSGELVFEKQQDFVVWQQLGDVLTSLNYTKQEIAKATAYVVQKNQDQQAPLDQLIRKALAYLSQKQV